MRLRNINLGRDRVWEFNDLAEHAGPEMPAYRTTKIYGGQLQSPKRRIKYAGSGSAETVVEPRMEKRATRNGIALIERGTFHPVYERKIRECVVAVKTRGG